MADRRAAADASKLDITVDTKEDGPTLAKCHDQSQSVLFDKLPREIRDNIWAYATAQTEDPNHLYEKNRFYCRPGHTARHRTSTTLLYTCRRVWLEAHTLPMLQAEHCFWYYRNAPDGRDAKWMAKLTAMNRRDFGELHLFAQMFFIERLQAHTGSLRRFFLSTEPEPEDFQPRSLRVTIRHTDWWFWESDEPLRLEDRWLQALLDTPDLRSTETLQLELETLDYKVEQLTPIVDRLSKLESKQYATHVISGKEEETKFVLTGKPAVYTWSGPSNLDGGHYAPYEGVDTLNYHVVSLTWRLCFPNVPRARIPQLRRAPRLESNDDFPVHWTDDSEDEEEWDDEEDEDDEE